MTESSSHDVMSRVSELMEVEPHRSATGFEQGDVGCQRPGLRVDRGNQNLERGVGRFVSGLWCPATRSSGRQEKTEHGRRY